MLSNMVNKGIVFIIFITFTLTRIYIHYANKLGIIMFYLLLNDSSEIFGKMEFVVVER